MNVLKFEINSIEFRIKDLEDKDLNASFIEMYTIYFTGDREDLEQRLTLFLPKLFDASAKALAARKEDDFDYHDSYFENFTILTEDSWKKGFSEQVSRVWNKVALFVKDFEIKNFLIHKGSLYYFWGIPLLLLERIDASILALHRAVLEDKRNKPLAWEGAPGNMVLTLNNAPGPYLKEYLIDPSVGFIQKRIDVYNNKVSKKFTFEDLKVKFLSEKKLDSELKYYFTLAVLKLQYVSRLDNQGLGDGTIGPLVLNSSFGAILLIVENLLKIKYGNSDTFGGNLPRLIKEISLDQLDLKVEGVERAKDFQNWLNQRLGKTLREDLATSYGLRNNSFHSLENESVIWSKHTEITQSIFNSLFSIIEAGL